MSDNIPDDIPEAIRQWIEADKRAWRTHFIEQAVIAGMTVLALGLAALWWLT